MKYKYLFFDIDNTLLDFDASEEAALKKLYEDYGLSCGNEDIELYRSINEAMWRKCELGELTINDILKNRFSLVFAEYGLKVDGLEVENEYRKNLNSGHHLVKGAMELLEDLKLDYKIYAVTNGVAETQHRRLKDSDIEKFFDGIFISGEVGYNKPDEKYFQYVFERVEDFDEESGLIIGDNLTSDILGGNLMGVDTCWFNIHNVDNTTDIVPDYTIYNLKELYEVLK